MTYKFIVPFAVLLMVASGNQSGAACNGKGCVSLNQGGTMLRGSGKVVTETRRVERFNAISMSSSGEIVLERTGTPGLTISAEDNLLPFFTSEVKAGTLYLDFAKGKSYEGMGPKYRITVGDFRSLEISGSGDANLTKLNDDQLKVNFSGSVSARFAGRVNEFDVDISGSGDIVAQDLVAKRAKVSISGSGDVAVNVTDSLNVDISGAADVTYVGNPKVVKDISGSGTVTRRR